MREFPGSRRYFRFNRFKHAPQNTEAIATALLHQFIVPFEIASLLLLVSMIGAVVLARRRV